MIRSLLAPLALASTTALLALPRPAQACGGTFCDAGPSSMPVDQSGETILFVMEEGWVEAHVQVDYQGNPEEFAWIVPVMAQPEVSVGSSPFIQAALDATVPTFTVSSRSEGDCDPVFDGGGIGCGTVDSVAFAEDGGDWDDDPGAPLVRAKDVAGAYEFAVLEGGTAEGVGQWLDDNGYARDDQAPEILQSYLDDGFLFVAFKLRSGAGLDQIHPVVLRYQGSEPCIPLRLTRIAAVDDMPIRAIFFGNDRVVPTNYRHVELNPVRFNWSSQGANYDAVVSEAVDAEGADGRAFVTEYAGTSSVVDQSMVLNPAWQSEWWLNVDDSNVGTLLENQGLMQCQIQSSPWDGPPNPDDGTRECAFSHPLIAGLLQEFLPPPAGISLEAFYECPDCYGADTDTWDPLGFMAAFEERIVAPGEHAADVLQNNPYLTRLYTRISPGEMTSDPLFHERDDLPDVSADWSAVRVNHCEENDRFELANGTTIYLDDSGREPQLTETNAALVVEEIPLMGAPMVLTEASDEELEDWNATFGPRQGCDCRAPRRRMRGSGWLGLLVLMGLRARARRRARRR